MSNIFISDMAKARIMNEKANYVNSKKQSVAPCLIYYTRSYSIINHKNVEHGPGLMLSFVENAESNESYILVHVERGFPVYVGPSAMFDGGTHFIDWGSGKFKLNSIRS